MASVAQIAANRGNSLKSTGPVSIEGKKKVSGNALRHGIFSNKLVLKDEDPDEYRALLEQLQAELKPVGILESSLVERVALSLWRQQRLVRAETAYIELERKAGDIVAAVNQALKLGRSENAVTAKDLAELDAGLYRWCVGFLKEYDALDSVADLDMAILKASAPLIHRQILEDAEGYGGSVAELFEDYDCSDNYLRGLADFCRSD